MTLLFFYLAFLSYLPFKGLFTFFLSKVFLTFKKLEAHGGFYSYINQ